MMIGLTLSVVPADISLFCLVSIAAYAVVSLWHHRHGHNLRLILAAWPILLMLLGVGWLMVERAGSRERADLRKQIEGLAPTYAYEFEQMGHWNVTPDTSPDDPLYLEMIEKQIRLLELNPAVADIYTFRQHRDGNQLIVDSETDYDHDGTYTEDREQRTEIGEIWAEFSPFIDKAFAGEASFR